MEINHLSFSSIKAFLNSPQDFVRYKTSKKEPTQAMVIGKAIHCKILEPDKFDEQYMVLVADRRTTVGKEAYAKAIESGKEILSQEDMTKINNMYNVVMNNPVSRGILDSITETEVKIEFKEEGFDILGYIDGRSDKINLELKSTSKPEPREFHKEIINRGYHVQQAIYGVASPNRSHVIIAFDEFNVSVHILSDELLQHGYKEFKRALSDIKMCQDLDLWNCSYDFKAPDGYFTVELPAWLK